MFDKIYDDNTENTTKQAEITELSSKQNYLHNLREGGRDVGNYYCRGLNP